MSIEADAQKDLALNAEDAENVVGGKMNKKKKVAAKKKTAKKTAAKSLPMINIQTNPTPVVETPIDDCDPGDPAVVAVESAGSAGA